MSRRRLIVSVDVERDIPRFLQDEYQGVERALEPCLDTIRGCGFVADLFVESHVAHRFSELLTSLHNRGHFIGYHGDHRDPAYATQLGQPALDMLVRDGLNTLSNLLGRAPLAFRAPNFAVNPGVFRTLMRFGFRVDSSVLPNRFVRRWYGGRVLDHRGLPSRPYFVDSSVETIKRRILEIPITENPLNPGNPVGTGYLNWRGVEETWRALSGARGDPLTFLIHPWECLDLGKLHPGLPQWVKAISQENTSELRNLLTRAQSAFEPATLPSVAEEQEVNLR